MRRRQPSPPPDPPDVVALVAVLVARGEGPDDDLRRLLLSLRQARVIEVRAIEHYLGLPPARSERSRTRPTLDDKPPRP